MPRTLKVRGTFPGWEVTKSAPRPHSRKSLRLPEYDYSLPGGYFVTACTWEREFLFATPETIGAVQHAWEGLPDIFADIELAAAVVMPNHFHGILWITGEGAYRLHPGKPSFPRRDGQLPVPTSPMARLLDPTGARGKPPVHTGASQKFVSLGNIVGAFKTRAASEVNCLRGQTGAPVWQAGYYERVIRGEGEAEKIREYILLNPERWPSDRNNPESGHFDRSFDRFEDPLEEFNPLDR